MQINQFPFLFEILFCFQIAKAFMECYATPWPLLRDSRIFFFFFFFGQPHKDAPTKEHPGSLTICCHNTLTATAYQPIHNLNTTGTFKQGCPRDSRIVWCNMDYLHCHGALMGPDYKLTYLDVHQSLLQTPLLQPVPTPLFSTRMYPDLIRSTVH